MPNIDKDDENATRYEPGLDEQIEDERDFHQGLVAGDCREDMIEMSAAKQMNFPAHKGAMYITHNDHKSAYQPLGEWIEDQNDRFEFENDEAKARCLATDELWELQWYPETPVGFYSVAAPTFEEAVAFANAAIAGKGK